MVRSKKVTDSNGHVSTELRKEWRHLVRFTHENQLVYTAFLTVFTALLIINALFIVSYYRNPKTQTSQSYIDSRLVLASQHQSVTSMYTASISDVATIDKPDRAFPLADDETMLLLNLFIKNTSNQEQQFYPVKQLYIRDEEGRTFGPHASMYVTDPLPAGTIPPGGMAKGQITFAVKKTALSHHLYIDTGWGSQVPVVYDLHK